MRSSSNGNGYRPHYHKKLLISPKFETNDSSINKSTWTTKSEEQNKNSFSFQGNNLYNASTAICTVQSHSTKAAINGQSNNQNNNNNNNITLNNSTIGGYSNSSSSQQQYQQLQQNQNQQQQRASSNVFDTCNSVKSGSGGNNKKVSQIFNKQSILGNISNSNNNTPKNTSTKSRFSINNGNVIEQVRKRILSTQNNSTNHNNNNNNNNVNNNTLNLQLNNESSFLSAIELPSQDISAQNSRFSSGPSPKSKIFVPITTKNANQQQAIVMHAIKNKIKNIFSQQQQQQQQKQQQQQLILQQSQVQQQTQILQPQQYNQNIYQQQITIRKKKKDLVLSLKKSSENLQDVLIQNSQMTQPNSTKSAISRNKIKCENIAPHTSSHQNQQQHQHQNQFLYQQNDFYYNDEDNNTTTTIQDITDAKFISQINRQKKPPQPKKGATVPTNQSIINLSYNKQSSHGNHQQISSDHENHHFNSNTLNGVKKINRYNNNDDYNKKSNNNNNNNTIKSMYAHNKDNNHSSNNNSINNSINNQINNNNNNSQNDSISINSHVYSKSTNNSASKTNSNNGILSKSPFQTNQTPTNNLRKPKLSLNNSHINSNNNNNNSINNRASSFNMEEDNQTKFLKNVESFTNSQQSKLKSLRQILNDSNNNSNNNNNNINNTELRQNTNISINSLPNDHLNTNDNTTLLIHNSKDQLINSDQTNLEIKDWALVQTPLKPEETIAKYGNYLTDYEKTEIKLFQEVYFIGHQCKKKFQKSQSSQQYNNGFDDSRSDYVLNLLDHIAYRYELLESLGKGSFGSVMKVFDHKRKEFLALKIIRNKKKFHNQALIELNILSYIKEQDKEESTNIVRVKDFVIFRKHVCLVFELLSINLYELLRNNKFKGLSLELIRRFAIQILNSINFLRKHRIIHCDLKPENILLKQANKSGVKLVDFGSSCFENERLYSYIQSRYYRAPEVILGLPYDMAIDMWSFGCIMAELFIGYPIFPGEDEQEQMGYIWEIIGVPSSEFLSNCSRRKYFFNEDFTPRLIANSKGKIRVPNSKNLKNILQTDSEDFIDFLQKCFVWDPTKRIKASDALMHQWILEGLPAEIRSQHIKYIQSQAEIERLAYEQNLQKNNQGNNNYQQQQLKQQQNQKQQSSQSEQQSQESNINNNNLETAAFNQIQYQQKEQITKPEIKEFSQFGIPQNLDVQSSKNASEKNKNNLYIQSPMNGNNNNNNNINNQNQQKMKAESTKHTYEPNSNLIEKQLYFAAQKRKSNYSSDKQ